MLLAEIFVEFSSKVIGSSRHHLIRLITGLSDGQKAWWIVKINPSKYEIYKTDVTKEFFEIAKYGDVIYKGWGTKPKEYILQKLLDQYFPVAV